VSHLGVNAFFRHRDNCLSNRLIIQGHRATVVPQTMHGIRLPHVDTGQVVGQFGASLVVDQPFVDGNGLIIQPQETGNPGRPQTGPRAGCQETCT
jgi:hypothetical protein